uniref:NAC domain-containing protein n=1 Tax=Leersia perrieri TaxID=77586 RepID=A0A0D9VRC3_9ORYZ
MAKEVAPPPSPSPCLDSDAEDVPLSVRRRRLLRPQAQRVDSKPPATERRDASAEAVEGAGGAAQQGWPGLPRGVEFNPSDSDLLWHLAAEVGNGQACRHPFIDEFIKSVDETDGRVSYFFHKNFKVCNSENGKCTSWQKSENPISIILDGNIQGCKEEFVLYAYETDGNSPQVTDWRWHQYHIKSTEKGEGELVVSKIFYKSENNNFKWAEKAHAQSALDASATDDDSKEELRLENHSSKMVIESSILQGNENKQKQIQKETCPDQSKLIPFNMADNMSIGNQINDHDEIKELDHMSLQERYRILLAEKHSCSAVVSFEQCAIDGTENSCRPETSGLIPKRIHEGTPFRDGMHSMLQEISSGPPSIDSIGNDNNRMLLAEGLANNQQSQESGCNSSHVEGLLPSLRIKNEVTGNELPLIICGLTSMNTAELTAKKKNTVNHDGALAYCSQKRKGRKTVRNPSEKTLEECSDRNGEDTTYFSRRKRRRKTATDSIETALEEDAPGLLQILIDRGILVNEIKLYGVEEDDDMVPDCTESDFQDLENVITKLFPQRTSLLKLAARQVKGEKAIYCLTCLISLIEQSRYLQFRDCPVEWGWCRDLQSFIFIFKSHNRIVLERPEYGYATYFFEIVKSLPIEWQIQRLVTAMKLSGCGRTALIENKPLVVGEDLTEGEARVLEEYGWLPNSGLGTMLNYRDRVVHDRWNEKSVTDWRTKIGKLLMSGYSEGHLVLSHIPTKVGKLEEDTEMVSW